MPFIPILRRITRMAFSSVHGFEPKPFQVDAAAHILHCAAVNGNGATAIMLCASTGGGKSAVRDCSSFALGGGVALTIVPLLALAGDQTSKLINISKTNKHISAFNLDRIKEGNSKKRLQTALLESLDPASGHTVYLFASPQTISNDSTWKATFQSLIKKKLLITLSIDECHLYASFGVEFRREFVALRECLFQHVQQAEYSIPVLFMTGTGSRPMIGELEQLTGLVFSIEDNVKWPIMPSAFSRRNVTLGIKFDSTPLRLVKAKLRTLDDAMEKTKMIVYTNSVKRSHTIHTNSRTLMNSELISGDVLIVNGTLFREQKSHNTQIFSGPDLTETIQNEDGSESQLHFNPRVLVATAGAANAGLDSPDVRIIARDGFPPTIQDMTQELGRAARYHDASPLDNSYTLVISLPAFFSLLFRIFVVPILAREQEVAKQKLEQATMTLAAKEAKARHEQSILGSRHIATDVDAIDEDDPLAWMNGGDTTTASTNTTPPPIHSSSHHNNALLNAPDLVKRQYGNLKSVLELICLYNKQCIHSKLEMRLVNPFSTYQEAPSPPCGNACWICNKEQQASVLSMYLPISKEGLRFVLIDIFYHQNTSIDKRLLQHSVLVETLSSYKDSSGRTFQSIVFKRTAPSTSKTECRGLILRLFANGVFEPALDGKRLYCSLAMDNTMTPTVHSNSAFIGFDLID
jgi:hypothetical protein